MSLRDLTQALGLSEVSVKVAIHRMRRRFGVLLREEASHTLDDPSPADVDDEHLAAFVKRLSSLVREAVSEDAGK